jgi:hypothetical protein
MSALPDDSVMTDTINRAFCAFAIILFVIGCSYKGTPFYSDEIRPAPAQTRLSVPDINAACEGFDRVAARHQLLPCNYSRSVDLRCYEKQAFLAFTIPTPVNASLALAPDHSKMTFYSWQPTKSITGSLSEEVEREVRSELVEKFGKDRVVRITLYAPYSPF